MKHGSFRTVWLALMVCIAAVSAFGDENTVNLESRLLDTFDTDRPQDAEGRRYVWKAVGSKFATAPEGEDPFPRLAYVNTWPSQVYGYDSSRLRNPEPPYAEVDSSTLMSLGIHGRFDRREYNWIDIYPTVEGDEGSTDSNGNSTGPSPAEIPIPGRVRTIDVWVWGSMLHYRMEAYVRDYLGIVHRLDLGSLYHTGWKNLQVSVPASIPQYQRVLPHYTGLSFVKFRIWTPPEEPVNNFYIYIDRLKVFTDTFETHYDGEDLGNPARVQELWDASSGSASGSSGSN